MPVTLPLYNGRRIGFTYAQESEEDIIQRIAWHSSAVSATAHLKRQSEQGLISSLAAHHLRIEATRCVVEPTKNWPFGSFNQCVPIGVHDPSTGTAGSRLLLRVPMAHRLTGMVDEKMRCEVATYIWMQENCPDIPIPRLYGFGFPDGRHFTHASLLPWHIRWTRSLRRRICAWFGWPVPSYYIENPWVHDFPAGYILLEFIDRGKPLAKSWFSQSADPAKRQNLFRGISRLILKLARVPLDRIGSFTFDPNTGTISLTNRPLTCCLAIIENDGAPRVMDADQTYESVDPYVADLLTLHDNRFLAQHNAVTSKEDCYYQMAIQAILRIMSHHYLDRALRQGPFYMQLTDLHQGNMIVDDDWNITGLIDLEWICSRSPQMIDIPHWITSRSVDEVCSPQYSAEYAAARESFMAAFKEEEREISGDLSETIEKAWSSKATWFFHSLDSINAMYQLFELQLRPQFISEQIPEQVDPYFAVFWTRQARETTIQKLREKKEYIAKLREMFQVETGIQLEGGDGE
ncbi:hypothetical protein C8A00DRAFT_45227 [Chaetomidium leptoderma]|uniref:Aminoglycoside phosphotransferase domain-containing protein n=1 Tax=Chaetomidium leptoderma TaxID=669021 RepID=A0AAN6VHF9_9PEZI|nr:hypothetical protein C8A00DRAFT_45227 [Chaetomidium leptoderma]